MPRSSRLVPAIAGLLICLLTCSPVCAVVGFQKTSNDKVGKTNTKNTASKKSKKRKKKKSVGPIPYLSFGLPAPVQNNALPIQGNSQLTSAPVLTKGTNRAARSPRVHITPVGKEFVGAPSFSGSNAGAITIDSSQVDAVPIPAIPYSSDIDVSGLVGNVTSVTVTINGLTHPSPDDLDMLLVAPNGTSFHMWSDVGGTTAVAGATITLSDAAGAALPDNGPLVDGSTYRPFNNDTTDDEFPPPAPGSQYGEPSPAGDPTPATFASLFNGLTGDQAGGTWSLYVTDDNDYQNDIDEAEVTNEGTIAGGWTLNITTQVPANTAGQIIISEFRTSGPNGPSDEFIELYNTTGAPLVVQASDASSGLGVAASDGIVRCVVPNGTVIPSNGHYLCVNSGNSENLRRNSLVNAGLVDQSFGGDIFENAGIAVFSSSGTGPASQNLTTRLDAVGSTSEANTLFKEGAGYSPVTGTSLEYAFYRDLRPSGQPKDTGNNAADFLFVDTNGTSAGAGQRLGAPGPQGLTDPRTANDGVFNGLIAPCVAASQPPNRIRSFTTDPANNSSFGTLSIRRAFFNSTANQITTLRFRIIDITTFPAPAGVADLRFRTSVTTVETDGCGGQDPVNILGITVDGPSQPNGGGFNSSGTVNLPAALEPGETIYVEFLLGIQQTGSFRFYVNIEALP